MIVPAPAERRDAHVEAQQLVFAAGGRPILGGIDLIVERGERLGVIGPNGSGKSTLLRCLYGWHRPTGGAVLLDERSLAGIAADERARAIAVLAQEPQSGLGLTVREVVALGRLPHRASWGAERPEDSRHIEAALDAVGLASCRDRPFPSLSGGEQQRVLFARALAQDPALLIMDEPTNHLDIRHQLDLLRLARDRAITVVASLHDLNLAARWCDRLCLMEGGAIRAIGPCWDVLDPALIGAVYGVAVDRDSDPRTGRPRLAFRLEP